MDATTALRFHFGEITISLAFRALQIAVIGPSPLTVAVWQVFLFLCILFHHSNVRLSLSLERMLARFVVTPRLHGIHHSIVPEEVNSNWSSGLTIWDWLHSTLRTEPPQAALTLGVPGISRSHRDYCCGGSEAAFRSCSGSTGIRRDTGQAIVGCAELSLSPASLPIPIRERVGVNACPIQNLQRRPMQPHTREVSVFEAPRRSHDARLQVHETPRSSAAASADPNLQKRRMNESRRPLRRWSGVRRCRNRRSRGSTGAASDRWPSIAALPEMDHRR